MASLTALMRLPAESSGRVPEDKNTSDLRARQRKNIADSQKIIRPRISLFPPSLLPSRPYFPSTRTHRRATIRPSVDFIVDARARASSRSNSATVQATLFRGKGRERRRVVRLRRVRGGCSRLRTRTVPLADAQRRNGRREDGGRETSSRSVFYRRDAITTVRFAAEIAFDSIASYREIRVNTTRRFVYLARS